MYFIINAFTFFVVILYFTFCVMYSRDLYLRLKEKRALKRMKKTGKKIKNVEPVKPVELPVPNTEWEMHEVKP